MRPSGATCLPADCCFSELALYKSNAACWFRTMRTSSSSQFNNQRSKKISLINTCFILICIVYLLKYLNNNVTVAFYICRPSLLLLDNNNRNRTVGAPCLSMYVVYCMFSYLEGLSTDFVGNTNTIYIYV
jgi:hypothetical protein